MSNSNTPRGGTLISQIHQVCGRVWNALLRRAGLEDLEGARGRVLFVLWQHNRVSAKLLSEKTSLDKSTLTGILFRLERDGYIQREADPQDKRSQLICRTGKDNFFSDKIPAVSNQMNSMFYKGFTPDEIVLFDSMLERVLANCKEAEKTAR